LGIAEIADLLRVTRQAVANWRSRDANFPAPVADLKAGPVFARADIVAWARSNDIRVVDGDITTQREGPCIVSVVNAKGGVGKSTLTLNLGWYCFFRMLKKVLLVDLDPQFNLSQYALGSEGYEKLIKDEKPTITSIFSPDGASSKKKRKLGLEAIHPIRTFRGAKLDLLPSDLNLAWSVRDGYAKNDLLSNYLRHTVSRDAYDLILIDCPPTDSVLTDAAFAASEYLLIPVRPEFLSAVGLPLIDRSLERFREIKPDARLSVAGVVINAVVDSKEEYTQSKADITRAAKRFDWHVFNQEISFSDSYPRGARLSRPIFMTDYARWDKKVEISALAKEFASRVKL
jgi:chromosome partitioning protein